MNILRLSVIAAAAGLLAACAGARDITREDDLRDAVRAAPDVARASELALTSTAGGMIFRLPNGAHF